MRVELPDGTILDNIPEGTTKAQIEAKLAANGYDMKKLAQSPAPAAAPAAKEPDSLLSRIGTGLADPVIGVAQLADKVINPIRQMISPGASSMADYQKQREAEYVAPEGVDWGRTGGRMVTDVGSMLTPAGMLNKTLAASRAVRPAVDFARKTLGHMGLGAGYGAATANDGERGQAAALGAAGEAIVPVAKVLTKALGGGAANILGGTTGAGAETFRQAYKGGDEFVANMRDKVDFGDVVEKAKTGVDKMRQDMYQRYATAKGGWANDTKPLDFVPIVQSYVDAAKKFSFEGTPQPGVADVKVKVEQVLSDWLSNAKGNPKFATVEGMDALKRHLATIVPADVNNRAGRSFVTSVTDSVKDGIIAQRPQYADAMKDYWKSTNEIDEISKSLSLGDKASTDTALRKLQSLMRNTTASNFGQKTKYAEQLADKGGQDVMPAVAGQTANSWLPRGGMRGVTSTVLPMGILSGGLGVIPAVGTAALQSPRLMGETTRALGAINRMTQKMLPDEIRRLMMMSAMLQSGQGDDQQNLGE